MIVNENAARHDYVGTGSTTDFPFTFGIDDVSEIEVLLDGLAPGANFLVSGVGNAGGGFVRITPAPAANVAVTLLRKQPIKQTSDYQANEDFPAERLEGDLGKVVRVCQMLAERFRRTLLFSKHFTTVDQFLPIPKPGDATRWKADGSGMENWTPGTGVIAIPVAISNGGTSATTVADAKTNLGIPSLGRSIMASQVFGG